MNALILIIQYLKIMIIYINLKHNYLKKYNSNGSIFTLNINPFEDCETLLYGHNMKNGTMFSILGKYLDKDFFTFTSKIKIYTPNKNYEGVIFSAYSQE